MSELDDFLAGETQTGKTPVVPRADVAPLPVKATSELDGFLQSEVQANPMVLDNAEALEIKPVAPGVSQIGQGDDSLVGKMVRRGLSEVPRAAASLFEEGPRLLRGAAAALSEAPDPVGGPLAPQVNLAPGENPIRSTPLPYESPLAEFGYDIEKLAPMKLAEQQQFAKQHPMLEGGSAALGQLGSMYALPFGRTSALTLGAKESKEDVQAVEQRTGIPVDQEAKLTAELIGGALGSTDILPYEQAMRGVFRAVPGPVYATMAKSLEKWWRAQSVGARYASETAATAVSEGLQEGFQQWGQNMTARDWVGYDPGRDPTDTLKENMQGGFGAGVVFDAVLKVLHGRGLKTVRAEDRRYQLAQEAETKAGDKAKLEATLGETPTVGPTLAAANVEDTKQRTKVAERQLSTETAKLVDLQNQASPEPDLNTFDRQASKAVDFFEPLATVTQSDVNRFLALGVNPSEGQLVSDLHNKLGSTTTGAQFAKAIQSQLFPLVGVEFDAAHSNIAAAGVNFLYGENLPATAVSWESPIVLPQQDVQRDTGIAVAGSHIFTPRNQTGVPPEQSLAKFHEAAKRAVLFRLGHIRYAESLDGVPFVLEVQSDRIPQRASVLPEQILGAKPEPSTVATPAQQQLLKGEVNQRGLRYILRNQMAKFSAAGKTRFRLIHPDDLNKISGVRAGSITHKSYELLADWLTKNFVTREGVTPRSSVRYIEVDIPSNFHDFEIPFGADLGRPIEKVATPYEVHERTINDLITDLIAGRNLQSQVFKTGQLRKQVQAMRERLRLQEKELRKAVRYEAMKQGIKDLEQEIRSREAGARRLNNILNWGGRGGSRPPGTPGFGGAGADSLDKDSISWAQEGFGTLMDLAYNNKHIQPLQDLARHVWFKHADMMRHVHKAIETVKVLNSLPRKQRDVLFSTMMQVVIDSRETGLRFTDSALVKELQAKGAKDVTIEAYFRVRRDFDQAVETLKGALHANLRANMIREGRWDALADAPNSPEAQADYDKRGTEISDTLERWKGHEYFPFLRFGKWKVRVVARGSVIKDGKSYVAGDTVEHLHFPTEKEAKAAAKELEEIYKGQPVTLEQGMRVQSPFAVSTGVPEGFLAQLTQKLNLTDDQKHILFEMAAKTAPSKSFIQRYLKKKLVSGYSEDGIRAYADYFYSFASYISNLKYDHLIDQYRAELRASTDKFKDQPQVDTTNRDRISQYVEHHVDRLRANQNEYATFRQVGTFWFLGLVPKTAFVNMLQVPMILYPYAAARYGEKALGKIGDAYGGQIGNAILSTAKRLMKVQNRAPLNVDKGLDDILTFLYESGKMTSSFLTELAAATSEDRIRAFSLGRTKRYWHEGVSLSMTPFQLAELLNRRVTVEVIYKLEMELRYPGKSWETLQPSQRKAVRETVVEALDRTMGEYSRWNRAKFQQGWKSPIFLFYGYMQMLLSFLAPFPTNTVQGAAARRAILIMLLVGGLEGLPFFGNLLDFLDTLLAKSPEKFKELWGQGFEELGGDSQTGAVPDIRGQMRDLLMHYTEGDVAVRDQIMNGLGKKYGLGPVHLLRAFDINVPEVDISGSLSVGRVIPGTDKLRQAVVQRDGSAAWEGLLEAAVGPLGSAASGSLRAMLDNDIDKWKQYERALPTFAKGISQGVRRQERGGETQNITDVTTPTTTGENALAAAGFRSTHLAQEQAVQWQLQERKLYFAGWRKSIFDEIERHVRSNKVKAEAGGELPPEVLKELERFNRVAPGGYKIGRDAIMRSLKDRLKSGATETAIGTESIKDLELLQEVERLVGPATSPAHDSKSSGH